MKFLYLAIATVVISLAQAVSLAPFAVLSLTFLGLNEPVVGFFGFFRRRTPGPSVIEQSAPPQAPIHMQPPTFPQRGSFFNPFPSAASPGFLNMPQITGQRFQQSGFQQQPFRQPWNTRNTPQPQMVQFQPPSLPEVEDSQPDFDEQGPSINTEEAESFFTLLAETDENKCISRLVCEMGADPLSAGELGTTISEIIGSLTDFPSGTKVAEYNEVLNNGRSQGMASCESQFSSCDQESYELMKNSPTGEES